MDRRSYRAIDLFAGIGGIRLGFKQAFKDKMKFVYANEIDNFACETYKANFGEDPSGDIRKVDPRNIPDFDILLAGFPCQAFSIAGEKRGFEDTRGTLFFHTAEILRIKQPQVFLLENVKHLKYHDKGKTFQIIKDVLTKDLSYHIYTRVLNAKNFGLPQNRARIFIVGFKDPLAFNFPSPTNKSAKIADILQMNVQEKYYLSQEYLNGLKKHRARHEAKGHGFGYEVIPRDEIANTIVTGGMGKERNLIKDEILPNCWKKEGDSLRLRNSEGIRKMTPKEWARLQGFPESFKFPVSMTRKYKLLANSVAIPVVREIAREILTSLDDKKVLKTMDLQDSDNQIYELLIGMYEDNSITKTGRKMVDTLKRYINTKCLRVTDIDSLINDMVKKNLIISKTDNSIVFNEKLTNLKSNSEFRKGLLELLGVEDRSILNEYLKTRSEQIKNEVL